MKASDSLVIWMICAAVAIGAFAAAMAIFNLYYENRQLEANYKALAEQEAVRAQITSVQKTSESASIVKFSVSIPGYYRLTTYRSGTTTLDLLSRY